MKIKILSDFNENKFYAFVEDRECHLCFEILPEGSIRFTSTYVPHGIRTKGIATELAKFAFDYAQKNNLRVIPKCVFIRRFIEKNPHLKEMVKDMESYSQ